MQRAENMMTLHFSPIRSNDTLVLERQGDILIANGEAFDFSPLAEGQSLPAQAVASPWFVGPVSRRGGVLELTVLLPHGANAPHAQRSPQPIGLTGDGLVALPAAPALET